MPQALGADQLLARGRERLPGAGPGAPAPRGSAESRSSPRSRPGAARHLPVPPALRPGPSDACAIASRARSHKVTARVSCAPACSPALTASLEGGVPAVEVTGQDRGQSQVEALAPVAPMPCAAHLPHGLPGVGAHQLNPPAARERAEDGGVCLGEGGARLGRLPALPSDRPRQPSAQPRPAARSGRRTARPARRPSDVLRSRPGPPATGTTSGWS